MAFADLSDVIELAHGHFVHMIDKVLAECPNELGTVLQRCKAR